jgi:O-methyltransferase
MAKQNDEPTSLSLRNTLLMLAGIAIAASVSMYFVLESDFSPIIKCTLYGLIALLGLWLSMAAVFRRRIIIARGKYGPTVPYNAGDYKSVGLGPVVSGNPTEMYIDLMKRCVANILYEDQPTSFYDGQHGAQAATEFNLHRRVAGQDMPTAAHTMIGMHRLENIRNCFEDVLAKKVVGDFAETGSYRGGGTIFMRALLKAWGVTDRRVFVCDAFVPMEADLPPGIFFPLLRAIASIPGKSNRRWLYRILERMPQKHRAFPLCENPSHDWIETVFWTLRHPETIGVGDTTSRAHVESRFARYGLLDEQVVILEGFFADTLPNAPIDKLAVLRLDGDTYESTRDAIQLLYPRLSPGGYCIVDDYHAFDDCKRAIEEYRQQHGVQELIQEIDNMGVFWQKAPSAT